MQTSPCLTFTLRLSKEKETNTEMQVCDRRFNHYYYTDKNIGDIYKVTWLYVIEICVVRR